MKRHRLKHWKRGVSTMLPDPDGEWFHERDEMWSKLFVRGLFPLGSRGLVIQLDCRADILLSIDRAFRAWGGLK